MKFWTGNGNVAVDLLWCPTSRSSLRLRRVFVFFFFLTRRHLHILQMLRSDGVSGALTFNVKLSARMQMSVHKVSARRSDQTSRRFWNNTAAACGIDTGPDASLPSALCDWWRRYVDESKCGSRIRTTRHVWGIDKERARLKICRFNKERSAKKRIWMERPEQMKRNKKKTDGNWPTIHEQFDSGRKAEEAFVDWGPAV